MLKRKGLYTVLGLAGVLALLLGAVGAAYAQGPQPPVGDYPLHGYGTADHVGAMGYGWDRGRHGFSLVDAVAEATGLTEDEVIAALQEGQTFAEIAAAQGVDSQAVVDALLADRQAVLEQAVADGRITQEQMDWMLDEMGEHLSEHLTQSWTPYQHFGAGWMGHGGSGHGPRMGTGFFAPRQ